MSIEEGKKAPDFNLANQDGVPVSLSELAGRHVIVYFYPKDDTPGCTKEACGFRDLWSEIEALGAVVLGVSPDSSASHRKFIDNYSLPFTLLADPHKELMQAYGAWGEKKMYGRTVVGTIRSTVWIGPDGKVLRHWRRVPKAADHPAKVLQALQAYSAT